MCLHPQRNDIELDIVAGLRPPQLFEKYKDDNNLPSEGSMRRHINSNHLGNSNDGAILVRSRAELLSEAELTNEAIVAKLAVMVTDAESIQDRATENEQPSLALTAMREIRAALALIHKFAIKDENEEASRGNTADATALELAALAKALRRALPAYPEARDAIVEYLIDDGHIELASAVSSVRSLNFVPAA